MADNMEVEDRVPLGTSHKTEFEHKPCNPEIAAAFLAFIRTIYGNEFEYDWTVITFDKCNVSAIIGRDDLKPTEAGPEICIRHVTERGLSKFKAQLVSIP